MVKRLIYFLSTIFFLNENLKAYNRNVQMSLDGVAHPSISENFFNPIIHLSKFLTMWCLYLNTIYYFGRTISPKNKQILLDQFFCGIVFPISMIVGVYFWILFICDRENLIPKKFQSYWSEYDHHAQHSIAPILALVEVLFLQKNRLADLWNNRTSKIKKITLTMGFSMSYVVILYCYFVKDGRWAYPFLAPLWNTSYHFGYIIFAVVTFFVAIGLSALVPYLNDRRLKINVSKLK